MPMKRFFATLLQGASAALKAVVSTGAATLGYLAAADVPGVSTLGRVGFAGGSFVLSYIVQHAWHTAKAPTTPDPKA